MNSSRWISLHLQLSGLECPLFADENVEVVISGVQTSMTLGTQWCAKYNKVFSDACMDDVHGTHGTPCITEYPFFSVRVQGNLVSRVSAGQVLNDVIYHPSSIIGRCLDGLLGKLVKECRLKDIPPLLPWHYQSISFKFSYPTLMVSSQPQKATNRERTATREAHLTKEFCGDSTFTPFDLGFAAIRVSG